MSKYKGIDERQIKCCDDNPVSIEGGLSFDQLPNGQNVLRFHFLDYVKINQDRFILTQVTKSMYLNETNIKELIKELEKLEF